jgi:hypothetical protein
VSWSASSLHDGNGHVAEIDGFLQEATARVVFAEELAGFVVGVSADCDGGWEKGKI